LGKAAFCILSCLPKFLRNIMSPLFSTVILIAPMAFTGTREIFAVFAIIEYGPALGLPNVKALLHRLMAFVGFGSALDILPLGLGGFSEKAESFWKALITPWCNPIMKLLLDLGPAIAVVIALAAVPRILNFFAPQYFVQIVGAIVFVALECLAERDLLLEDGLKLWIAVLATLVTLLLPSAQDHWETGQEEDELEGSEESHEPEDIDGAAVTDGNDVPDDIEPCDPSEKTLGAPKKQHNGDANRATPTKSAVWSERARWLLVLIACAGFLTELLKRAHVAKYGSSSKIPDYFDMDVISCAGIVWGATVDSSESMTCVLCEPDPPIRGRSFKAFKSLFPMGALASSFYCVAMRYCV